MSTTQAEREGACTAPRRPDLYAPQKPQGPIDLRLDANEGSVPCVDLAALVTKADAESTRCYPCASSLERTIAARLNVRPAQVMVTAGADEAIDRVCRALLGLGSELILPAPTFEMIARFARLAGATVVSPPWPSGPFPTEAVLERISERTAMIAVVSPNNPTGAVASARDLEALSKAAPHALLVVDLAYTEFADEDLTAVALAISNAVVLRTLSKAWGLAGLRIGYAAGPEGVITAMRGAGGPFSASALSLAAAEESLRSGGPTMQRSVARVRLERARLRDLLAELGAVPVDSQANFVLAEFDNPDWVWRALAGLGIAVRRFDEGSGLERSLRITCPGVEASFDRLCAGLRAAVHPQGLLFDMDGVLADVSGSYRRAIALTTESFGVSVTPEQVGAAKAEPDSNNDWVVTQRLLARAGVSVGLAKVTERFEMLYHGTGWAPGLEQEEALIPARQWLAELASRARLGIVTGRPRRDAERFLRRFGLGDLFGTVVCMEDGPLKPDPAPVRRAIEQLGVETAWMIGDTPDDMVAARRAGVVPVGIGAPGDERTQQSERLERAGAARVLASLEELKEMLP